MRLSQSDAIFGATRSDESLAGKTVRGGMATMSAQATLFAVNTAGMVVLARLLTPRDYGLIGMVMVVVGFAEMIKDAGLSTATIQKDEISREQISTLFWINVMISAGLGVCVLAASPLVAWFYQKPELTAVTAVLSFSFVISGMMMQHQALLRRHMQFNALAIVLVASKFLSIAVAITLALLGWRYWSLVGGTIALALAGTLLTYYFCPWMPGGMKKGTGVREMLKFGGHLTAFSIINFLSVNVGLVILGRTQPASTVGSYSRAQSLFMLPLTQIRAPINSVMIPALSQCQHDHDRYRRFYYALVLVLASVTMPLALVMAMFARDIILLVLGPQWEESVRIFQVLALYGVIYTVATTRGLVLVTLGRADKYARWGIIYGGSNVTSIAIGSFWGAVGIAWGVVVVNYLLFLPSLVYCFRDSPISPKGFLKACTGPLVCSVSCALLVLLLHDSLRPLGRYQSPVEGVVYVGAYALTWFAFLYSWHKDEMMTIGRAVGTVWRKPQP